MKLSRVSAARLASSCVGDVGVDAIATDTAPEPVDRPAKLPVLLAWCRVRGDMAASNPKASAGISCTGDSIADEGPVPDVLYFGVNGSVVCAGLIYSRGGILGTV